MNTYTTISEHPLFPPGGGKTKTITSERRLTA